MERLLYVSNSKIKEAEVDAVVSHIVTKAEEWNVLTTTCSPSFLLGLPARFVVTETTGTRRGSVPGLERAINEAGDV